MTSHARLDWLIPLGGFLAFAASGGARALPTLELDGAIPYVDLHVDIPYQHNYKEASFLRGTGQFSAEMAQKGGLYAVVFPLFVPVTASKKVPTVSDYEQSWQNIEESLDKQNIYAHPGAEPAAGQVRTFYSFEGMGTLGDDLPALERWVRRGVRLFGLVHNQHNALAASSMDYHGEDFGLTALGAAGCYPHLRTGCHRRHFACV